MIGQPRRLGKYTLLERLAEGGMAEVYRATCRGVGGFEKVLALKRIRARYARETRFIENFIDEARIASALSHRNIVRIFDFGRDTGELYLAMELVWGVDLRSALLEAKLRRLPPPLALACAIVSEIGRGLHYSHFHCDGDGEPLRIVHCDVSPHNVMLGFEGFVKIFDFGVARACFSRVTETRRLRGKPRYMAPEQTRGALPEPSADVFALGILSWELLTGQPLFWRPTVGATLEAVRTAKVPPAHSLERALPRRASDAVARALSSDPRHRGTALDLATALGDTAAELDSMHPSRLLSEWLGALYPRGV